MTGMEKWEWLLGAKWVYFFKKKSTLTTLFLSCVRILSPKLMVWSLHPM